MKQASDLKIPFTWEERHPIMLDRIFYIPTHYENHQSSKMLSWEDSSLFGNSRPVIVEYCSGNGQWICERAKQFPDVNWVAVEKRFDRSRKIWLRLHREEIKNLIVVCSEAFTFTKYYVPKQSISKVFVNFPDPWPKFRHAKHRLIREEFMQELEQVIVPQGEVYFTTDDRPYVDQMLQVLMSRTSWQSINPFPYFVTDDPSFGSSYFCDLWKQKGRNIYHIHFKANL